MKKLIIAALLALSVIWHNKAEIEFPIWEAIAMTETQFNPKVTGDNGKAIGILQIHKEVVDEVNSTYETKFKYKDRWDISKSIAIFYLYLHKGAMLFYKKHHHYPNKYQLVRMWNGGIYQGHKIKSTYNYYKKYLLYEAIWKLKNKEVHLIVDGRNKITTKIINNHKLKYIRHTKTTLTVWDSTIQKYILFYTRRDRIGRIPKNTVILPVKGIFVIKH